MNASLQQSHLSLPSHASTEAHRLIAAALLKGNSALAAKLSASTLNMLPSAEEFEAQLASQLFQERSRVVVLVRADHAAAAAALNKHQFESRTARRYFLHLKEMAVAFWASR